MKTKFIILTICCLIISNISTAQILKKLKKKAEQATERTILKKTDEIVTQKTEKTIDDVANGSEKKQDSVHKSTKQNNTALNSKKTDNVKLPDHYEFDWELKTIIASGKNDRMDMNYLINSNTTDYFGVEMSNEELKGQGKMIMVMDNIRKSNIMFMDMSGQKMGQHHKMPELKEGKNNENMSFKEIGTKEILGYTCYGIEVEDKNYIGQLYFTLDAPVSFSAFFAMANNKSAPKGFDPALLQVLKEDALLMEMNMMHKTKTKENYTMTAVSLEKTKLELDIKDYQFMKFGG